MGCNWLLQQMAVRPRGSHRPFRMSECSPIDERLNFCEMPFRKQRHESVPTRRDPEPPAGQGGRWPADHWGRGPVFRRSWRKRQGGRTGACRMTTSMVFSLCLLTARSNKTTGGRVGALRETPERYQAKGSRACFSHAPSQTTPGVACSRKSVSLWFTVLAAKQSSGQELIEQTPRPSDDPRQEHKIND